MRFTPLACTAGCIAAIPLFAQGQGALDTRFIIVLSQPEDRVGIVATLTTSSTYPCEGYRIRTHVTQSFDTLTVHVGGIVRPFPCYRSFGTATGETFLELRGINFVRFAYRGKNDLYRLVFARNLIQLHPLQASFTETTN